MTKKNSRRESFLSGLNVTSIDSDNDNIALRCKFNFSYFDHSQPEAKDFSDLSQLDLERLLNKLKEYSKFSLQHWSRQPVGRGSGHILEIYGPFPVKTKSEFTEPKHVPHQAEWGRFRLDNDARLVGFILPEIRHKTIQKSTNEFFDCNTFYVVFYDSEHKFYLPKKR